MLSVLIIPAITIPHMHNISNLRVLDAVYELATAPSAKQRGVRSCIVCKGVKLARVKISSTQRKMEDLESNMRRSIYRRMQDGYHQSRTSQPSCPPA